MWGSFDWSSLAGGFGKQPMAADSPGFVGPKQPATFGKDFLSAADKAGPSRTAGFDPEQPVRRKWTSEAERAIGPGIIDERKS